jgi:hypothetical protein
MMRVWIQCSVFTWVDSVTMEESMGDGKANA